MKETTLETYKEEILRVLVHIQHNLDEELSLDDLARLACFSPYHFHRIFRGMVGESVQEHIRRLRLERAATQLKHTTWSVITIALEAGYETHEGFTRAFRAMFGEAPSRFRSQRRSIPLPTTPSGVHYHPGGALNDFTPVCSGGDRMDVHIKKVEPMRVAFMRHVGPYSECGATWDKLLAWVGSRGLLGPDTIFVGLCYDDPEVTAPERVRYDACVTMDEDCAPEGDVGTQIIPGGQYAVTTHLGTYDKMGETYSELLGQWVPRAGREVRAAPCLEIYLNDPESTDPEDLLTDLYAPLEAE